MRIGLATVFLRSTSLLITILLSGCAFALKPHIPAFEKTFRLAVPQPSQYAIRVKADSFEDFPVGSNGVVCIKVPESPHRCDYYLFGRINLGGSGWPHIYVLKNNRTVSELSPLALWKQEPNSNGVCELRLE